MAKQKVESRVPLSLDRHFEPPENCTGSFGWICGYSADIAALNQVLDRFTNSTMASRAGRGAVQLVLMLDPGFQQIPLTEVPGLHHALLKGEESRPFLLLHAKFALLHFKSEDTNQKDIIRLLVCTGNWTSETISESLDLIFQCELESDSFNITTNSMVQYRADIAKAWDLMKFIRTHFDYSLVTSEKTGLSCTRYKAFEDLMEKIRTPRNCPPRFFDNREKSLYEQLPGLIRKHCREAARNYLAIGAGFFEEAGKKKGVPSVILKIEEKLTSERLLTKNPCKELYVNPKSCQSVATNKDAIAESNWCIKAGQDPLNRKGYNPRNLHAKFIFSANTQPDKPAISSGWLYMGSGNITRAGFMNRMSRHAGNLEAGIILDPGQLKWKSRTRRPENQTDYLEDRLPLNTETTHEFGSGELQPGSGYIHKEKQYEAPPVSWFNFDCSGDNNLILPAPSAVNIPYHPMMPGGERCTPQGKGWIWTGPAPTMVEVCWGKGWNKQAYVPVLDDAGRLAAKEVIACNLDEAIWLLEHNNSHDDIDGDVMEEDTTAVTHVQGNTKTSQYPVRRMMKLVEVIASRQLKEPVHNWSIWCQDLLQILLRLRGSEELIQFRKDWGINPLSPLWNKVFRPSFAADKTTKEGRVYEKVLDQVEKALEFSNLEEL